MATETITLDVRVFYIDPPEHAGGPCLCDDCWHEYLGWCDQQGDELDPRRERKWPAAS